MSKFQGLVLLFAGFSALFLALCLSLAGQPAAKVSEFPPPSFATITLAPSQTLTATPIASPTADVMGEHVFHVQTLSADGGPEARETLSVLGPTVIALATQLQSSPTPTVTATPWPYQSDCVTRAAVDDAPVLGDILLGEPKHPTLELNQQVVVLAREGAYWLIYTSKEHFSEGVIQKVFHTYLQEADCLRNVPRL